VFEPNLPRFCRVINPPAVASPGLCLKERALLHTLKSVQCHKLPLVPDCGPFRYRHGNVLYCTSNIYVRAAAYSLDCHGGAIVNHKIYRTFQSSIDHRTESVRSMDHELSVAKSSIELVLPLALTSFL